MSCIASICLLALCAVAPPRVLPHTQGFTFPQFSPDGRSLLAAGEGLADLVVIDVATGAARRVAAERGAAFRAVWTRNARAVLSRVPAGSGYVVRMIPLDGSPAADLCPPADDVGYPLAEDAPVVHGGTASWTRTADARIVVSATRSGALLLSHPDGRSDSLTAGGHPFYGPRAAPRGDLVVVNRLGEGLALVDARTGTLTPGGEGTSPCWLPDGSGVVCEVARDDGHAVVRSDLWRVAVNGARDQLTFTADVVEQHVDVSTDGRWIAYDTPGGLCIAEVRP